MDGPSFLSWLGERRSVRYFRERRVERAVLKRLVRAAITAPSSTNRQPWRFTVVRDPAMRAAVASAVREQTEAIEAVIARSHHAETFGSYGDFFFEPLERADVIIVPQYRPHPDQLEHLIRSGGADPKAFGTPSAMQPELCATSGAIMLLLLQAHAEGLGACWMAGPMVACDALHELLDIRPPYRMVGAIAIGYPLDAPPATTRRAVERSVIWLDEPGAQG